MSLRVLSLEVHLIELRGHEVFKMRRVLLHLFLILLSGYHVQGPTTVELRDQMNALRMVYSILFPALLDFLLQLHCFFGEDISTFLEVSPNELAVNDSLWGITHYFIVYLIL